MFNLMCTRVLGIQSQTAYTIPALFAAATERAKN